LDEFWLREALAKKIMELSAMVEENE